MAIGVQIRDVLSAMPSDLSSFLSKAIPSISVPGLPTDEASSILAMGYAAYNECKVLKEFEGFKPIPLFLRLGMLSPAGIASIILQCYYDSEGSYSTAEAFWPSSFHTPGDLSHDGAFTPEEVLQDTYLDSLDSYSSSIFDWYTDTSARIAADEEAFAADLLLPYSEILPLPSPLPLPSLPDVRYPPAIYILMWLVKLVLDANILPVLKHIAEEIIRRLRTGGSSTALLKVFRKFAFLRKEDPDQGFEDLTSLLLLNADKPLEIINSQGQFDVFLDTIIDEGEPPEEP